MISRLMIPIVGQDLTDSSALLFITVFAVLTSI